MSVAATSAPTRKVAVVPGIDEERRKHQADCPGLLDCADHPVPYVIIDGPCYLVHAAHESIPTNHTHNLEWALEAAHALTHAPHAHEKGPTSERDEENGHTHARPSNRRTGAHMDPHDEVRALTCHCGRIACRHHEGDDDD